MRVWDGACVCVCVCVWIGECKWLEKVHLLSISNAENARAWTLYTHLQLLISLVPVGPGNETIILIFLPGVSSQYSIPVSLGNLDTATAFAGLQSDTSSISCLSFIREHVIVDQNS